MRCEYDKDADALYMYFEFPLKKGSVKKSVEAGENVILDYDAKKKLLGVEILQASKVMKKESLTAMIRS